MALLTFLAFASLGTACSHSIFESKKIQEVDPAVDRIELAPRTQVEAHGKKAMISTQGRAATLAARKILKEGGNLMDAAVAASLAISVERPQSTGLGGGGFLVYHEAKSGKNFAFDFRERAPLSATREMYLNKTGEVIQDLSRAGGLSIAVPGLVRGLKAVHARFGKRKWQQLFGPAIELAEKGLEPYPALNKAIADKASELTKYRDSKKIFLDQKAKIIQADLAQTLRRLSIDPEDFYQGQTASRIISTIQKVGGIMTLADLAHYQVKERVSVESDWRGYQLVTMPPPSSGGVHVVQILKMLEHDALTPDSFLKPQTWHLMASAMQQAFADRSRYLGDPDFVKVPVKGLISDDFIKLERERFNIERARSKSEVDAGAVSFAEFTESNETSHLSLMDDAGNVVVTTQSVNGWFGSKVVAEDTGIVLNNTMDDFSAKPGASNIYGAVGGDANAIAPGKTPLSSMSPTLILKNGRPVMAIGAPGGTRIITAVAQTILNYFVFKRSIYDSVAAPRIHQQWTPDALMIENQMVSVETLKAMDRLGYIIKRIPVESNVMAIVKEGDEMVGVADPRDIGTSVGF